MPLHRVIDPVCLGRLTIETSHLRACIPSRWTRPALLALCLVMPGAARAVCNLIPTAPAEFRSTQGTVSSPLAAPGQPVVLRIDLACSPGASGFDPAAADNLVTLRFVPPGSAGNPALVTSLALPATSVAPANCAQGGGRCDSLRVVLPDSATLDAALAPNGDGLGPAGPAQIEVRSPGSALLAQIGPLFDQTPACSDLQPESVFGHFVVLPAPNDFGQLTSGSVSTARATLDGNGSLLVPFDYGAVLPSLSGAALFRILQAGADLDAFSGSPGFPIRVPNAGYVRSFSLQGRPIPPVLEIDGNGAFILGSIDARLSVIRISRLAPNGGGPPLFDVTDRFSQGGRGPILVPNVVASTKESAPLATLSADASGISFARSEILDALDLDFDGDQQDRVPQIIEPGTGQSFSAAEPATEVSVPGFVKPALTAGEGLVAFAASEARNGFAALNGDGDRFDQLLRVFRVSGAHLTALLSQVAVDPFPSVGRRPIGISGGFVFFRTPENAAAARTTEAATGERFPENRPRRGDSDSPALDADGSVLVFASSGGPTFLETAPSGGPHIYAWDRATDTFELINRNAIGEPGNAPAFSPSVSADGRYVAFGSNASNLVAGDTNGRGDVFVFDRVTGTTVCASCTTTGVGDAAAFFGRISGNGRFVVYWRTSGTDFANLNRYFLYDRVTDTTEPALDPEPDVDPYDYYAYGRPQISFDGRIVAGAGTRILEATPGSGGIETLLYDRATRRIVQFNGPLGDGPFSLGADGTTYAFTTSAPFDVNDVNASSDVYVLGDVAGALSRGVVGAEDLEIVSTDNEGRIQLGSLTDRAVALSGDGRFVAFVADADGLVPGATSARQAFRFDRASNTLEAVSVDGAGAFAGGMANDVAISADGQAVALSTFAALTPNTLDVQNVFVRDHVPAPSLNGDGDDADTVLQIFDPGTAALRATPRVAASDVDLSQGRAAFLSAEAADGGVDRNTDGDATDTVARVYDAATDELREIGVAANRVDLEGDTLCLTVPEAQEARPEYRNGDADLDDDVLAVGSLSAGGLPASLGVAAVEVRATAGGCVFATRESDQGAGADLNEDGDTADTVLRYFDGAAIVETRLAVQDFVVKGSVVGFRVCEAAQNDAPLNDDGDTADCVMHALDLVSGQVSNSGRAAALCEIEGCDPFFEPYRVGTNTVSFLLQESDQSGPGPGLGFACQVSSFESCPEGGGLCNRQVVPGGCDLNDDDDNVDLLIAVHSLASGRTQIVTLAEGGTAAPQETPPFPAEQSGKTVLQFQVYETDRDLNDDGIIGVEPVLILIGDTDNDGTLDDAQGGGRDVCAEVSNPAQVDADRDQLGDQDCDPGPTASLPGDLACDVDLNGVIDRRDVDVVFRDRGMQARASDPRDPDGDREVTVLDVGLCSRSCSLAGCAEPVASACGLLGLEPLLLVGLLLGWRSAPRPLLRRKTR